MTVYSFESPALPPDALVRSPASLWVVVPVPMVLTSIVFDGPRPECAIVRQIEVGRRIVFSSKFNFSATLFSRLGGKTVWGEELPNGRIVSSDDVHFSVHAGESISADLERNPVMLGVALIRLVVTGESR